MSKTSETIQRNLDSCLQELTVHGVTKLGYELKIVHPESAMYYEFKGFCDHHNKYIAIPLPCIVQNKKQALLKMLRKLIATCLVKENEELTWLSVFESIHPQEEGKEELFHNNFYYTCSNSCMYEETLGYSTYHEDVMCYVCGEPLVPSLINYEDLMCCA